MCQGTNDTELNPERSLRVGTDFQPFRRTAFLLTIAHFPSTTPNAALRFQPPAEGSGTDTNIGESYMLHIGKGCPSALVNEFILRPWLIETVIFARTRPRGDVRVSICVNMPEKESKSQIIDPWDQMKPTSECSHLLGSH
jgi:hypothetical protein